MTRRYCPPFAFLQVVVAWAASRALASPCQIPSWETIAVGCRDCRAAFWSTRLLTKPPTTQPCNSRCADHPMWHTHTASLWSLCSACLLLP